MAVMNPNATLTKLGSNLEFLKDWTASNEQVFAGAMQCLAEENPAKFAELYLRAQTMIMEPKDNKPKTNINISVKGDMDTLKTLAGTVDPARKIESPSQKTEFTKYEEL